MFNRIRAQIARPWIKRPRGIALLLATFVILTNSSVFAQRGGAGGAGCAATSGTSGGSTGTSSFGTGTFGTGGFGAGGGQVVAGGFNRPRSRFANPAQMVIPGPPALRHTHAAPTLF